MASRLERLQSLADVLEMSLTEAEPDKRGPLAAQLRGTLADIATLESDDAKAGDPVDEIAKRRAARGAGSAAGSVRAKRSR
jgi:hypothetical protein